MIKRKCRRIGEPKIKPAPPVKVKVKPAKKVYKPKPKPKIRTVGQVSALTLMRLKEKNISILEKKNRPPYSRKFIEGGYDLLENMFVVRAYYRRELNIDIFTIELLMTLYPKGFFSIQDYYVIPRRYMYMRIKKLIQLGHVVIFSKGKIKGTDVYTLSIASKHLVENFYKMLSGEKKIPECARHNKMARVRDVTDMDKRRLNFIKSVNSMPVSETKKALHSK